MFVKILLLLLAGEALCQYITHPLGAISYISTSHYHPRVDYSYVAPAGQSVNVKFASSASIKPHRAQISAVPQYNPSRFVFHSAPAVLPITPNRQPSEYSFFQPQRAQPAFFQQDFRAIRPATPSPESLFVPSNGIGPAQSEKQLQAYKDYLKEIAQEDARAAVTEARVPDEYEPESLSYVDVGEK